VERSGRDESIWVVIHMCMEAMLGISLYSYPYLKLAKMLCFSYYCLCLLFNKIGEQVLPGSEGDGERVRELGGQEGEITQTMYPRMNK
jgi:hypothetical protein